MTHSQESKCLFLKDQQKTLDSSRRSGACGGGGGVLSPGTKPQQCPLDPSALCIMEPRGTQEEALGPHFGPQSNCLPDTAGGSAFTMHPDSNPATGFWQVRDPLHFLLHLRDGSRVTYLKALLRCHHVSAPAPGLGGGGHSGPTSNRHKHTSPPAPGPALTQGSPRRRPQVPLPPGTGCSLPAPAPPHAGVCPTKHWHGAR